MAALAFDAPSQNCTDPVDCLYNQDRSLNTHTLPASGIPDPNIVQAFQNSTIAQEYTKIKPERSVLIYDCAQNSPYNWCGQVDFSLGSMFKVAARVSDPGHHDTSTLANTLATGWLSAAQKLDRSLSTIHFASVDQMPFQMLAVANRLDLAQWDGKVYSRAEIHLEYGALDSTVPAGPNRMLIVEFVLTPQTPASLQTIGKAWEDLSAASPANYASSLKSALETTGLPLQDGGVSNVELVRIRTNDNPAGDGWAFTQMALNPNSAAFTPAPLDGQLKTGIQNDAQSYNSLWARLQTQTFSPGAVGYSIAASWAAGAAIKYSDPIQPGFGLPMPAGICNPSTTLRNNLAMQQCTLCHTVETGTCFKQIANRAVTDSSVPSGFLVGHDPGGTSLHPDPVLLYYGDPKTVWTSDIHFAAYSCSGQPIAAPELVRSFHDIARRTLFLAAMVVSPTHGPFRVKQPPTYFSTSLPE